MGICLNSSVARIFSQRAIPCSLRQKDIGDDDVRLFPEDQVEAAGAVGGQGDDVARVAEQLLQGFLDDMVVIDDHDSLAHIAPVSVKKPDISIT